MAPAPQILTVKQAAELLTLSPVAVYELCSSGKLPHYRLGVGGKSIRLDRDVVMDYLDSCLVAAKHPDRPAEETPKPRGKKPFRYEILKDRLPACMRG